MPEQIRFYFDEHIPGPVTEALLRRNIDVLTAQVAEQRGRSDREQLAFATISGRVLVTFDDDYLVLGNEPIHHTGIVYCPATKYSIGDLMRALLLLHEVISPLDMSGHIEFL